MASSRNLALLLAALCFLSGCQGSLLAPTNRPNGIAAPEMLSYSKRALEDKQYAETIKWFELIDETYPFSQEAAKAATYASQAYYANQDYTTALAVTERYLHAYPKSEDAAYMCYLHGLISLDSNRSWLQKAFDIDIAQLDKHNLHAALQSFNEVKRVYPDSPYAAKAEEKIALINGALSRYELDVARFYLSRKNYAAAIDRANIALSYADDKLRLDIQSFLKDVKAIADHHDATK